MAGRPDNTQVNGNVKVYSGILALLLLSGCSVLPSFVWPWSKNREKAVAKAEVRADIAMMDVLREAQEQIEVAAGALARAMESREVTLARSATASAASLQAQAIGPLPEKERQRLQQQVEELLSENEQIRTAAEKQRALDLVKVAETSEALAAARQSLEDATGKLREGYLREKALADKYRGLMWTAYGVGALALLLGAAWIYVRVTTGGALTRIVGGIERFKSAHADAAPGLLEELSKVMDRGDKVLVRKVAAGVKP